jgi:hypothetical protein
MRVSVSAGLPAPHRAPLAPGWTFFVPSARYDDIRYEVSLLADGTWSCTCKAFQHGSRLDRECRHIDIAREERERRLTLAFLLS